MTFLCVTFLGVSRQASESLAIITSPEWHPICLVNGTKPAGNAYNPMVEFNFEPINVNASAPGGARVIRTFDDVGTFILNSVQLPRRLGDHWRIVRQDLAQARFGARRLEVHAATRAALAAEGWLAE